MASSPQVISLHSSEKHSFSKQSKSEVVLVEGVGVEGDSHAGVTVKHRSRVRFDPTQPNLRQVHLLQAETLDELATRGFEIQPGDIGENITTQGIDLLAMPRDTLLWVGDSACVRLTGLRNPCVQLDRFKSGLMATLLDRGEDGELIRKAGVMSVVVSGGIVRVGDEISVEYPDEPVFAMDKV